MKYSITVVFFILLCMFSYAQDFEKIFRKYNVEGSITIYDLNSNHWIFSDKNNASFATLPASTFKIINSCIALQNKVIKDENEIIDWDGKVRTFNGKAVDEWNKDSDLKTAYKNSTVWFYVELAKRIGRTKYIDVLNKINYGNGDLSEEGIDFWNYGNFKVTPIQQILFLKNLYDCSLPFDKEIIENVKQIMISEENEKYTIRSKTGWTNKDGIDIGWNIGYITTHNNVYFFANRIFKPISQQNLAFGSARKDILIEAFEQIGLL